MNDPRDACPHCDAPIKSTTFVCSKCNNVIDARPVTSQASPATGNKIGIAVSACSALAFVVLATCAVVSPREPSPPPAATEAAEVHQPTDKWAFPSNDRDEILAEVERRIATGQRDAITMASVLMTERFGFGPVHTDPELRPVWDRIKAADAVASADDNAAAAEDRATQLREQIAKLGTDDPNSVRGVMNDLTTLQEAARDIEAMAAGKDRSSSLTALKTKQRDMLPTYRKAYGKLLGQQMWEQNINVRTTGSGNRTLIFTGSIFASNANIAEAQRGAGDIYRRLRFSRVRYEWYRDGDGAFYDQDVPSDHQPGYWAGSAFTPVK